MESEKGPVATEAPPFSPSATQPPVTQAPVSVESLEAEAARATQSLKRQREATPTSPGSEPAARLDTVLSSPSKAARLLNLTARHSPAPLTGAAAAEDEKRRQEEEYRLQVSGASDNPAYRAQAALMSADSLAMSRPQDAPMTEEAQIDTPSIDPLPPAVVSDTDPKDDISPQSAPSIATLGSGAEPVTTSPAPMDLDARNDRSGFGAQPPAQMEDKAGLSLSYPGILPTAQNMPAPPSRGSTMPATPSQQSAPRSPNSKKHKCPYCETEFTRHHNLKSHLLTHSQEKPYVCQTCQMRFRRLHDLKRHSKLHTGEKPHICPKCDRKFARGDALARHSKGPGGCVGRRSSMGGGFLDDELEGASQLEGDSEMADVVYDSTADASMTEEDRRRLSISGIKTSHVQAFSQPQTYGREQSDRQASPGFSAADAARYAASAAAGATSSITNAVSTHSLPGAQQELSGSQNGGSGDGASNNLFASDQGVWAYIHSLEEQVRQLVERVQTMETTERSQEERIGYLTDEVTNLRSLFEAKASEEVEKLD